jgi:predicted P-loop ATPase
VEVAELGGMRKADVDNLKAMLSRPVDSARLAYGRQKQDRPRRFIMFGTVNPGANGYLKDGTGNRRFWICPVHEIDVDAIARDRDQIWAEAVHRHRAGEQNWLCASVATAAEAVADERREDIPWADALRDKLGDRPEISADEALAVLGIPIERRNRSAQMQVAEALKEIGFIKCKKSGSAPRKWMRR